MEQSISQRWILSNYVTSKVTLYPGKIKALERAATQALSMTADAILTEVKDSQVVPFMQGTLQESGFVDYSRESQGEVEIVFQTPYARRLYYHPEYNFHQAPWTAVIQGTERTVGGNKFAGGKWFAPWIDGRYKNHCKQRYEYFLKQIGGV